MLISITKHKTKPPTLTCTRRDGTITWQTYGNQGAFLPLHDLTHFAVESVMGYRHAFFGMIAAGRELGDFGPGDAKAFHPEAHWAEMLAGLLTTASSGSHPLTYEVILSTVNAKLGTIGVEQIQLTQVQADAIRAQLLEFVEAWDKVDAGESIELAFID